MITVAALRQVSVSTRCAMMLGIALAGASRIARADVEDARSRGRGFRGFVGGRVSFMPGGAASFGIRCRSCEAAIAHAEAAARNRGAGTAENIDEVGPVVAGQRHDVELHLFKSPRAWSCRVVEDLGPLSSIGASLRGIDVDTIPLVSMARVAMSEPGSTSMTSNVSPRNGFPAHWRQPDADPLCSIDWRTEGVDMPYVFLITGRCGSTHLASLLTESRACGEPSEYFNPDWMPNFPEAGTARSLAEYIAVSCARGRAIAASASRSTTGGWKRSGPLSTSNSCFRLRSRCSFS